MHTLSLVSSSLAKNRSAGSLVWRCPFFFCCCCRFVLFGFSGFRLWLVWLASCYCFLFMAGCIYGWLAGWLLVVQCISLVLCVYLRQLGWCDRARGHKGTPLLRLYPIPPLTGGGSSEGNRCMEQPHPRMLGGGLPEGPHALAQHSACSRAAKE